MLLYEEGGWQGVGELERRLFCPGWRTEVKMAESSGLMVGNKSVADVYYVKWIKLAALTGTRSSNSSCFVRCDLDNWVESTT